MSEMTNEQLAAIRGRADNRACNSDWHETCMRRDHAALLAEVDRLRADDLINRVEVIDGMGRSYVRYTTADAVSIARQDDGHTLKIFIAEAPNV